MSTLQIYRVTLEELIYVNVQQHSIPSSNNSPFKTPAVVAVA